MRGRKKQTGVGRKEERKNKWNGCFDVVFEDQSLEDDEGWVERLMERSHGNTDKAGFGFG